MNGTGSPLALRARTVTDLLDAAVGLYRHNFGTLLGVVALVHGPLLALQVIASGLWGWSRLGLQSGNGPSAGGVVAMLAGFGAMGLVWVAQLIFTPLSTGAMVLSVSDLYLGRPVTVRDAYRRARRWWGPLIGAQFLIQLIVAGVGLIPGLALLFLGGALMGFTRSAAAGVVVMVLGVLVALILIVGAALCLLATIPALVVENRGVIEALTRSFRLVRRGWRHALGAYALLGLLVAVPILVAYGLGFGAEMRGGTASLPLTGALAGGIASLAVLLVMPISLAGGVVIYYDLRVRQEGFDLEMMAANLGLKAAGTPGLPPPVSLRQKAIPPPPPPPPSEPHPQPPPFGGE